VPHKGGGFSPIPPSEVLEDSALRFPRQAPETGYDVSELAYTWTFRPDSGGQGTFSAVTGNHFFRVRTKHDAAGDVTTALYGKLVCDTRYNLKKNASLDVKLTYWLYPTPNDRNVEFNPEQNLFRDLKWNEKVDRP